MKKETRILKPTEALQSRAIEEDGKKYIEGYASVFEQRSKLIAEGGKVFNEVIERGAFDEVLADSPDVIHTRNHNSDSIMGRTVSGTLELSVDDYGLKYRVEVPNVSYANDTYELVKRGDMFENSFIFSVNEEGQSWSRNEAGENLRSIQKVSHLYDVSVVTSGAYANTDVAARECKNFEATLEEARSKEESLYTNESDKDKLKLLKLT